MHVQPPFELWLPVCQLYPYSALYRVNLQFFSALLHSFDAPNFVSYLLCWFWQVINIMNFNNQSAITIPQQIHCVVNCMNILVFFYYIIIYISIFLLPLWFYCSQKQCRLKMHWMRYISTAGYAPRVVSQYQAKYWKDYNCFEIWCRL